MEKEFDYLYELDDLEGFEDAPEVVEFAKAEDTPPTSEELQQSLRTPTPKPNPSEITVTAEGDFILPDELVVKTEKVATPATEKVATPATEKVATPATEKVATPATEPAVPGEVVLESSTAQEQLAIRQQMEAEGLSAFGSVDKPYSDTLDQLSYAEADIKARYAKNVASIVANVPKRLQSRYLAREEANVNEAMAYLQTKKQHIGGEIYGKLNDDARLVADQLQQRGVPGIQASKMAQRSEDIKRATNDMLSEYANNPVMYTALKNKLYGREERDPTTGRVIRENGLIQRNNYGVLDVVNKEEFDNLYKDVSAERAYRRSNTGIDRQVRGAGGTSGGSRSTKSPEAQQMAKITSAINAYDSRIEKMDETDPDREAIVEERDALFEQYRVLLRRDLDATQAEAQGMELDNSLQSAIDTRRVRKEDATIKGHEAAISDIYKKATGGVNDVVGRRQFNSSLSAYAKENNLPTITVKTVEDLKKLASITKPTIVIEEGRVGAGTGLTAKVLDRGAFQQWAQTTTAPETEAAHAKTYQEAERLSGLMFTKIRSLMPQGYTGDLKLDNDNRIIGASGEAKKVLDRYPQIVENYNTAISRKVAAQQNLNRIAMLKIALSGE